MTERPVRLGWGHVNVNVRDLDRSIEFYERLGFRRFLPAIPYLGLSSEASRQEADADAAAALGLAAGARGRACILQLRDGFPMLDLTEWEGGTPREPLRNDDLGVVRICLSSADLEADFARLREAGVSFVTEPKRGKDGLADLAVCLDPDGTRIELIQIDLPRWGPLLAAAAAEEEADAGG